MLCFEPTGTAATARATVGRDASSRRTLPTGPLVKGGESGDRGIAPPQNAARKKRQPAVRQSLRHGLRPCHLPLTREAKPPQTPRPTATPVGDDARIVPETHEPRATPPRALYWNRPCEPRTIPTTRPPARRGCVFSAFWGYNNRRNGYYTVLRSGSPLWLHASPATAFLMRNYTNSAARHGIIAAVNGCGVLKVSASARRGTKPRPAKQDGVIRFGNNPVYYTNCNCRNRPFSHFCALQLQTKGRGTVQRIVGFCRRHRLPLAGVLLAALWALVLAWAGVRPVRTGGRPAGLPDRQR